MKIPGIGVGGSDIKGVIANIKTKKFVAERH